jgi:molybdopterin molybdotransferase|tara:strand:+ start:234 stop:1436 length:1203 start_codon:yes stop_codon:yes gene_type:complete
METRVTPERAVAIAHTMPLPRKTETISLDRATGRVLSKPIPSLVDDPRFDNSAMDGFAVRNQDCDGRTTLRIVGESRAGGSEPPVVGVGEACRIMTGARIPDGADAIVIVEETEEDGDNVVIMGEPRPSFIRRRAENLSIGQEALPVGAALGPSEIGLAATMGHDRIPVVTKPRIAIVSTGDELAKPGEELAPSEIYESNSYALAAMVEEMGCTAVRHDAAPDTLDELRRVLDSLTECDAILTSGGVSMGEFDLVRRIMEDEGDPLFWKVAMRPGGPPMFGAWKGTPLFALPGNPVSSQVVFHVLVVPWIANSLQYHESLGPRMADRVRVRLLDDVRGAPGKLCLRRIRIETGDNELTGSVHTHQGSGNAHSMVAHNGLTLLPPDTEGKAGEIIDALWCR